MTQELDKSLKELRVTLDSDDIPLVASQQLSNRLQKLESIVRQAAQESLAKMMQHQVEVAVVDAGPASFVVASLSIPSELLEIGRAKLSLIKATRHCTSKPILVLAVDDGCLVGRCTVPQVSFSRVPLPTGDSQSKISISIGNGHAGL